MAPNPNPNPDIWLTLTDSSKLFAMFAPSSTGPYYVTLTLIELHVDEPIGRHLLGRSQVNYTHPCSAVQ